MRVNLKFSLPFHNIYWYEWNVITKKKENYNDENGSLSIWHEKHEACLWNKNLNCLSEY